MSNIAVLTIWLPIVVLISSWYLIKTSKKIFLNDNAYDACSILNHLSQTAFRPRHSSRYMYNSGIFSAVLILSYCLALQAEINKWHGHYLLVTWTWALRLGFVRDQRSTTLPDRPRLPLLIALPAWLLLSYLCFSFTKNTFHSSIYIIIWNIAIVLYARARGSL